MKRVAILLILHLVAGGSLLAQKYAVTKSNVTFYSDATIEDIKASNTEVSGLLVLNTSEVAFLIPINKFQFENSLMKEHFNEKYLESEKFPNAVFKGKFQGLNIESKSEQSVKAVGKLTIHGVTRDVEIPGTISFKEDNIIAVSKFVIKLKDYKIKIPQLMWQNIAEEVEVTVEFIYKAQ